MEDLFCHPLKRATLQQGADKVPGIIGHHKKGSFFTPKKRGEKHGFPQVDLLEFVALLKDA